MQIEERRHAYPGATLGNSSVVGHAAVKTQGTELARLQQYKSPQGRTVAPGSPGATVRICPGGKCWRKQLEDLACEEEHHLLASEGHVTHLTARDIPLLEHIDTRTRVGDPNSIRRTLNRLTAVGFCEVTYTPTGPDVIRELRAFASANSER
jgi:hypothetical protein